MRFVRVHLARPLFVQPHEPLKVSKLVPRALGDLVELLGDDVVEVRQSVGSEEVIDDGELGRAGALLLGFILLFSTYLGRIVISAILTCLEWLAQLL